MKACMGGFGDNGNTLCLGGLGGQTITNVPGGKLSVMYRKKETINIGTFVELTSADGRAGRKDAQFCVPANPVGFENC